MLCNSRSAGPRFGDTWQRQTPNGPIGQGDDAGCSCCMHGMLSASERGCKQPSTLARAEVAHASERGALLRQFRSYHTIPQSAPAAAPVLRRRRIHHAPHPRVVRADAQVSSPKHSLCTRWHTAGQKNTCFVYPPLLCRSGAGSQTPQRGCDSTLWWSHPVAPHGPVRRAKCLPPGVPFTSF